MEFTDGEKQVSDNKKILKKKYFLKEIRNKKQWQKKQKRKQQS